MVMQMTVTVAGSAQLFKKLAKAQIDIKDMSRELRLAGKFLKDFYGNEVFDSQGSVINKKWPPLNVAYRKRKQTKAPGKGPLEFSGKMRDSFVVKSGINKAVVSNKATYFKYHQSDRARKGNLPRRVMMILDRKRKKDVSDIIFKGVTSRLRRTFR